jgi:hypothetical protein
MGAAVEKFLTRNACTWAAAVESPELVSTVKERIHARPAEPRELVRSTVRGRQSLLDAGRASVTTGDVNVAGADAVNVLAAITPQESHAIPDAVHWALIRPALMLIGLFSERIGVPARVENLGKIDTLEASVHWQLEEAAPSKSNSLVQVNALPPPPRFVGESNVMTTALPSEVKVALRTVGRGGSDAAPWTVRIRAVV